MTEFGRYVMAKTAKNAIYTSNSFFQELNDAKRYGALRPVFGESGEVIGLTYPSSDGTLKTVSKADIAANAKRMQTAIFISGKVAERL